MNEDDLKRLLINQYEYAEPPPTIKKEVMDKINVLKVFKFLFDHHTQVPLHLLEVSLEDEDGDTEANESDSEKDS